MSDVATKQNSAAFTITGCARCGENHSSLQFKTLQRPMVITPQIVYSLWGLCPNTSEPIMMRVETEAELPAPELDSWLSMKDCCTPNPMCCQNSGDLSSSQ